MCVCVYRAREVQTEDETLPLPIFSTSSSLFFNHHRLKRDLNEHLLAGSTIRARVGEGGARIPLSLSLSISSHLFFSLPRSIPFFPRVPHDSSSSFLRSNDDAIYGEIKTDYEASVGVILTIITPFFLLFFEFFFLPKKFNYFVRIPYTVLHIEIRYFLSYDTKDFLDTERKIVIGEKIGKEGV